VLQHLNYHVLDYGRCWGLLLREGKVWQHPKYSRTSSKRPPKIQRLSGRLREVVIYKNQTTGGLFQEEVQDRWSLLGCGRYERWWHMEDRL